MRRAVLLAAAGTLVLAGCDTDDTTDTPTPTAGEEPDVGGEPPASPDQGTPDEGVVVEEEGSPGDTDPPPGTDDETMALGPPSAEIGAPVAFEPAVVEAEDVVVALTSITMHREGADLEVQVRWDPDAGGRDLQQGPGGPMDVTGEEPPTSEDDIPDTVLRVALQHPDGRVAATVDDLLATAAGEQPEEPTLTGHQGMGDDESWEQHLWTSPAPDEGEEALVFTVRWPAYDLDEQVEVDVDLDDLQQAADRVLVPFGDG
ncbi:hypothetical protein [Egicoccus halophilus]|uniref:Uncharacterized protein n=1 Tax=Egicoccus halophilus TaxID=1670830 RepID=A0A8J3AAH1_9ACTN|nr:hypothetical protein [Egicoccus halophilus]GGI06560.1 hypothetical protein GCM10011354_19700 [Egicoccus halophilus]